MEQAHLRGIGTLKEYGGKKFKLPSVLFEAEEIKRIVEEFGREKAIKMMMGNTFTEAYIIRLVKMVMDNGVDAGITRLHGPLVGFQYLKHKKVINNPKK